MTRKFTKRQIAHMHKIYRQTMSVLATARACKCAQSTIRKYRDQQKWVTPKQIKELSGGGNDTTLTTDIAMRLAVGWRMHIEDNKLCHVVGVTEAQLHMWLVRNTPCTVILTTKAADGSERKRMETLGLRTLREREWSSVSFSYIQRILENVKKMEGKDIEDLRGANYDLRWLLSKLEPEQFGEFNKELSVNVGVQANVVSIEDLNLDLKTCKRILSKIREKKQIEGETK